MSDTTGLDVIAIGLASVDFHGQQIGCRLEDMTSFGKAIGRGAANVAIGMARLGLRTGLITRIGDDALGDFVHGQLSHEDVSLEGVRSDPVRKTALTISAMRDDNDFEQCLYAADGAGALPDAGDIDPTYLARARAVLLNGPLFVEPSVAAAQKRAVAQVRSQGGRVILDLDCHRSLPAEREGDTPSVLLAAQLAEILPECDLVIGNERAIRFAGENGETLAALRTLRAGAPRAVIVCERGAAGCVAFDGAIPADIADAIHGQSFAWDVCNPRGCGDASLAGFLRGWLRGETLEACCIRANACGAIAVSRPLGASETPTAAELDHFLREGGSCQHLRFDTTLSHFRWLAERRKQATPILAFACDHRVQLEQIADEVGAPHERIAAFKLLAVAAATRVARGRPGFGMFLDGRYGRRALRVASQAGLWTARPVERTGSRPLDFEGGADGTVAVSLGAQLVEWPVSQVAKCLCFYHPDDSDALKALQLRELLRVQDACRCLGRDLLVEIIASKHGKLEDDTFARILQTLYGEGLRPDWWKLEPQRSRAAWQATGEVVERCDPYCRGILLLGLNAPIDQLEAAFEAAATPWVRGFAIGRSIFAEPARAWLAGSIDDDTAVGVMAQCFDRLVGSWEKFHGRLPVPGVIA